MTNSKRYINSHRSLRRQVARAWNGGVAFDGDQRSASRSMYPTWQGIAHVPPVRTLGQFVTQIRHGDVRAIPFE